MKKTLAALIALLIAAAAFATTSWTQITTVPSHTRCVQGWNPTSSGTDPAPVTSVISTDGIDLTGLESVEAFVESCTSLVGTNCNTAGGNLTAGGKLNAYLWPKTGAGKWYPVSDGSLDLTASAVQAQGFAGFTVAGDMGRFALEPTGLGTSTRVTICGTKRYPSNR